MLGQVDSGEAMATLRRFVGLTQAQFALAMSISSHTLLTHRNWEQGRRHPEGPAIALLRIAARHPRIIRENIERIEAAARASRSSSMTPGSVTNGRPIRAFAFPERGSRKTLADGFSAALPPAIPAIP